MTPPLPLVPAWLRAELVARPGRWRQALAMSCGATVGLTTALILQIATFPAPLIAFRALQPSVVCTWRNLLRWLAVIACATVVTIQAVGVMVQVPWLLLPVFILAITVATYFAPIQESPVAGYCIALMIGAVAYTAVFAPQEITATALTLAGGFAIGLLVATGFTYWDRADQPDAQLSRALAGAFARAQATLREAGQRYRAEADTSSALGRQSVPDSADRRPTTDDRIPTDAPPPDLSLSLAQHVQLLNLLRQERRRPDLERAFVALITAVERIELYIALLAGLARQSTARTYRHLVDRELADLLAALDVGLGRFAAAARSPECVLSTDAHPAARAGAWPDFAALVDALRARQHALSDAGELAAVGVEESANLNGFAQALAGLADVLHLPPQALEHVAPEPPPTAPRIAPFNPYAAQYALKIGVGCGLALLIGVASNAPQLQTIVLNPLLLAQGSYGATIRRADLRIIAVIVGGLLSVLTVVAVMPNTGEVTVWLLVFFSVVLPNAYIALGTPRFAYFGLQVATTFMIVLVDNGPVVDIHHALWRFYGTLIGSALLLATFQIFLPDYAGRQIVSRFGDMLRTLLAIVPRLDRPVLPVAQTQPRSDHIITALADILRLADEVWYEGADSGVERHAAVDAAGILRRVAHRWALIRRGRRAPLPPLPAALHDAIAALEGALLEHLRLLLEFVEARHDRGRPGSRSYRAACAAAAAVAARPRPDLATPLRELDAAAAAARRDVLHAWPIDAASGLLAEVGHLRRLVELLPALDVSLRRMCLPDAGAAVAAPALRTAAARL